MDETARGQYCFIRIEHETRRIMQDGAGSGKEVVTVPVDAELVARAKERGVDLGDVLERALRRELPGRTRSNSEAEAWRHENAEAIASWNDELARNGLWSDGRRLF